MVKDRGSLNAPRADFGVWVSGPIFAASAKRVTGPRAQIHVQFLGANKHVEIFTILQPTINVGSSITCETMILST